ncbi:Serine racemase [Zea mays]|uniref:Serine racemase n=1 Tax=Zea mays TaxID=4577 RepID=A0A1D6E3N2_MAIZE|nr:Serine racemase [Zea mays]
MPLLWLWLQSCVAYLRTLSFQEMHQRVRLKMLSATVVILFGAMPALNRENMFVKESRRRPALFLFIPSIVNTLSVVRVQYPLNFWSKSLKLTQ